MFIMVPLFLIFISKLSNSKEETPLCSKIYKCNPDDTSTTCYSEFNDKTTGIQYLTVKNCPQGTKCDINFTELSYTQYICNPTVTIKLVPGLYCANFTQCHSLNCKNNKCIGKQEGEQCEGNIDCDVGLYCDRNKKCTILKQIGEDCDNDQQCETIAGCNNRKCIKYLSLKDGELASNRLFCKSMFIAEKDGEVMCASSKRNSLNKFCDVEQTQCSYDYTFGDKGKKENVLVDCECTYSYSDRKICPYSTEGMDYLNALKDMETILFEYGPKLHTSIRGESIEDNRKIHLSAAKVFSTGVYGMEECPFYYITHNNFKLPPEH